jgi:hypothetical protein
VPFAARQSGPIRDKTDHGDGTATSTNWSGYAVLGASFTWAKGSWVVPAATCSGVTSDQYASFWVGLDGYNSNTVEQTGTDSDCVGGTPNYYAWYEFYPSASFNVDNFPVAPGDVIAAAVYYSATTDRFTVQITNETTGLTFTKGARVAGALRSSAEWITEAPCCTLNGGILPLSDFGTLAFGKDRTGVKTSNWAIDTSTTAPIGGFPAVNTVDIEKTSTQSSPQTSSCSALSGDKTSFTCKWTQ